MGTFFTDTVLYKYSLLMSMGGRDPSQRFVISTVSEFVRIKPRFLHGLA